MKILYFILPALFVCLSLWITVKFVKRGANKKKAILLQIASVALVMGISLFASVSEVSAAPATSTTSSQAKTTSEEGASSSKATSYGIGLIAAALALGLSGIGGGIAVASAAPAAIAAASEDPKSLGKSLIFLALGEGIAIYGLVISIMILGKLDVLLS